MTNPYFSSFTALPRNQLARCEAVNAIFSQIVAGFDLIPDLSAFQKGTNTFCTDTGLANAYVITPPNALSAYGVGQSFSFIALHTNTGASTANNSALGVRAIKRLDGADLNPGDILAGQVVEIRDDGTHYQITSPAGSDEAAAGASATAAAASASAANTSANAASASATASAASAAAASTSAGNAATSATNAGNSATAAAASATSITGFLTFAAGPKVGIGVAPGAFALNVNGTANLAGVVTMGSNATVAGTLGVTGDCHFNNNLTVDLTLTAAAVHSGNEVSATGFNVLNTMSWQGMALTGSGLPANFDIIAGTGGVRLPAGGTAWTALSSAAYKKLIQSIPGSALARCAKLKGQLFLYNEEPDDAPLRAGLIYEDVAAADAFPWAAHYSPERTFTQTNAAGEEESHTQAESKTISLEQHVPLLVDCVNELTARLAALEAKAA